MKLIAYVTFTVLAVAGFLHDVFVAVGVGLVGILAVAISSTGRKKGEERGKHEEQGKETFRGWARGPAQVIDGDSIRVGDVEIRLDGIDAPESDQPAKAGGWFNHGNVATKALRDKTAGHQCAVGLRGKDRYGRQLGILYVGNRDINREMVSEGLAVACYTDDYREVEENARRNAKGMWGMETAYHPVEWKRAKREGDAAPSMTKAYRDSVQDRIDEARHREIWR